MSEHDNSSGRARSPPTNDQAAQPVQDNTTPEIPTPNQVDEKEQADPTHRRSRSRQRSRSRDDSMSPHSKRARLRSSSRHSPDHGHRSRRDYSDDDEYYSRHRHRHGSYSPRRRKRSSSRRRHRSRSRSPSRSRRSRYKGCRVYVGNLAYDCRRDDLKSFAKEAGTVVHAEVLSTPSGKSKGCGIVEYSRSEYADRAMRILNRVEFMGRPVFVREDREYEAKIPKDPRDAPDDQRLFVGNLPYSTSWQDLKDLFRKAGRVTHTDIDSDPETRRSKGSGLVIYDDPRDAKAAIKMFDGSEFRGRILQVCEERNAPPPPPPQSETREPRERGGEEHRVRSTVEPYPPYDAGSVPPPPPHYAPMGMVGGPGASMPSHGPNQIFVNNLPFSTTWQDLIDLFRHVGPVVRAEILTSNGHPKGSGLVRFEEFAICERAIGKFNGYLYGGRYLDVRLDKFSTAG
ncbi:hypothetical protein BJV82DRAFT_623667 [Fennellomyces sp. T-0311]|nr:hypothetical protein BJV82DRAFT_623667 [Fennellomyces sp. T-0311]